jgi:hypothetical protein
MPFPMTAVIIATDYHFVILPIMTIILYSNITATTKVHVKAFHNLEHKKGTVICIVMMKG